jgi:ABC-type phosphate/phosphonate transport system substrate-binding protein
MIRITLRIVALSLLIAGCGSPSKPVAVDSGPKLPVLRIGFTGIGKGDCAPASPAFPAQLTAYLKHLTDRLDVPVQACPLANSAEGAKRLVDKSIDVAELDQASYAPVAATVRPFLTKRGNGDLGRTETVVVVPEASAIRAIAQIEGKSLIFAGKIAVMWDEPKHALSDAKISAATLAKATAAASPPLAMADLRAGKAEAMVLHAAAWTRLCRGAAAEDRPCAGLREIWRGRPRADQAWSMRRDMPVEMWVRLVGIHVALFQEVPAVAAWLAPGTTEIEPIEATGFDATSRTE